MCPVLNNSQPPHSNAANRPKREERKPDLLCRIKYNNTLPDVPFDPKFLAYPFDQNRFIKYKPTSLEKNYKWELLTEGDLGVKIDLINPDTYAIDPTGNSRMDPVDEKILEDEASNPQDAKRSQQHSKVVPWMRKTEYISSEFNRYGTQTERQETKVGYNIKKALKEETLYKDRDSQIQAINKTFDDVQKPVREHYSKPGVVAVQELPILPDYDLWKFPFAQVIFDADPAPVGLPANLQSDKMSQAVIRGMMDESGEQFVAYFLPLEETLQKRKEDETMDLDYRPGETYDYKLAREYNWTVKNKASKGYEENYFFVFRSDAVFYNELETRVRLSRRRAKEGQPKVANSRLMVRHREQNELEVAAQKVRMTLLQPVPEDEEEQADTSHEQEITTLDTTVEDDEEIQRAKKEKRQIMSDDEESNAEKSEEHESEEAEKVDSDGDSDNS